MPFYEYQCEDCGHRLEALQKMSDDRLVFCPACNEPKLKKLISAAAFQLKGTGWYETDFKNGGSKKAGDKSDSDSKSESKPDSKSDTKTDAKPDAKTDGKPASEKSSNTSTPVSQTTGTSSGGSDKPAPSAGA